MSDKADRLELSLNREEIRNCIITLARGEDRRDGALISAVFWPDAVCDFGIFKGNFQEYLDWVVPGAPQIPVTQHLLGQSYIELTGDTAKVETHVTAYHRISMESGDCDAVIGGRYLDRLARRKGVWRIAERTMLYDWVRNDGESVDWSQGVMGMPFSDEHFSGKAVGDFSEVFFKK